MTNPKIRRKPGARTGKFSFIISPLDDLTFSAARFVVMMVKIEDNKRVDLENVDDLSSIDFFATHPFIVFQPDSKAYLEMQYHGFSETLEYSHPKPIHANYREKAKTILAFLLGKRCIVEKIDKVILYALTTTGRSISEQLIEDYYIGYSFAVDEILKLIPKQQNKWKELRESWLEAIPKFTVV